MNNEEIKQKYEFRKMSNKNSAKLEDILVVAPNSHRRFSGVSATIFSLFPYQVKTLPIAILGTCFSEKFTKISFTQILKKGWSKPASRPFRIWHARRNNDMLIGIFLRSVLRQPWRLVFTWAGQRKQARLTRWFLRQMDAVIATSEAAASYLEVPAKVIHHGVDVQRYQPPQNRREAWLETGLPGRFGIGVFGRVRPQKGTDLFVKAMIKLLPHYPDATAIITGLVADEYQEFADELKHLIVGANLEKRIIFLGERPSDEMPLWFRRISLYVAPMRWEGFGLTPLEAMASGTPVISTKTGAAEKLIVNGETGILIAPDNLDDLSNAIEEFLLNFEKAEMMGNAGRAKTVTHHDIQMEAAAIQELYEELWVQNHE